MPELTLIRGGEERLTQEKQRRPKETEKKRKIPGLKEKEETEECLCTNHYWQTGKKTTT